MHIDGRVAVEDVSFAYREWGDGPTVLLLHGFPDSPGTFAALGEELAARGYHAVAPWMRGYGPTGGGAPRSMGQLGRDVLGLVEALAPGLPVAVVGHDWGAVAACIAATLRPGRLRRLVMLGLPHPAHFLSTIFANPAQLRRSWYIWFFQLPELPESALVGNDYALVDALWRDWSSTVRNPPHRDEIVATFEAGGVEGPIGYYRAIFADHAGDDPDDAALYGPVGTPTLSLMGENDGCVSPSFLVGQEQYWNAPLASDVVSGCGHFLHVERPHHVAEVISAFLGEKEQDS